MTPYIFGKRFSVIKFDSTSPIILVISKSDFTSFEFFEYSGCVEKSLSNSSHLQQQQKIFLKILKQPPIFIIILVCQIYIIK